MSENVALLGADPELFVTGLQKDARGRPLKWDTLPAFGLFGGNKNKPMQMEGMGEGFAYLEDNAALEFNIPPQSTADGFVETIKTAKRWLQRNKLDPQELTMSDSNVLVLAPKYQADPRGKEVGCLADFDAYGNGDAPKEREPFDANVLGNKRYAGGHFHIAYNHTVIPPFVAARFLDLYLTLPWLEYDRQADRRKVYGQAGLYRPKPYGLEYRSMSNWWLWHDTSGYLYRLADAALTFARRSYEQDYLRSLSDAFTGISWPAVQAAIANEDIYSARAIIEQADRAYGLGVRTRQRLPR